MFLDRRLLLQHITWQLAPRGFLDYDRLLQSIQALAPDGFSVTVRGGRQEHKGLRTRLHVAHGEVLTCVPATNDGSIDSQLYSGTPSHTAHDTNMSESSDESSSDTPESHTAHTGHAGRTERSRDRPSRSRSPAARRVPDRQIRGHNRVGIAFLGLGCVHLGHPTQACKVLPCSTDESQDPVAADLVSDPFSFGPYLQRLFRSPHKGATVKHGVRNSRLMPLGCQPLLLDLVVAIGVFLFQYLGASRYRILQRQLKHNTVQEQKYIAGPSDVTSEDRRHLRVLRNLTRTLGGRWLAGWSFLEQGDAPFGYPIPEETDSDVDEALQRIHFVVLKHDYVPERVAAHLRLPATQSEATAALGASRGHTAQSLFSFLMPIIPQPSDLAAWYLAAPAWNPGWHLICLDTTRIDGRIFAAFALEYITRRDILLLAEIPLGIEPIVWLAHSDCILEEGARAHIVPGALVCILPADMLPPRLRTLGEVLLTRAGWAEEPRDPCSQQIRAYCLAQRGQGRLYVPDPTRPMHYRRDIANAVGSNPATLQLYPARPRPRDVAISAITCRTVIGIQDGVSHPPGSHPGHLVLLDCRPIEEGWKTYSVPDGRLDIARLVETFDSEAPQVGRPVSWKSIDARVSCQLHRVRF